MRNEYRKNRPKPPPFLEPMIIIVGVVILGVILLWTR